MNLLFALCLAASCVAGCSTSESNSTPSSTPSKSPQTGLATALPTSTKEAENAPSISQEDHDKGIAEGNPYVIYSGVMCFGGTLMTPEELKAQGGSAEEIKQKEVDYQKTPDGVKKQSEENKKLGSSFKAPKECYEAGWSNPGSV